MRLESLQNSSNRRKSRIRVGRGIGSKGKTCGRGHKGQASRSGYKRRYGQEGGQAPLFKKLPTRGFSNARYKNRIAYVNLSDIEKNFQEGDLVNLSTLIEKGLVRPKSTGVKVLSIGEFTKAVSFEVSGFSKNALAKVEKSKSSVKLV